MVYYKYLENKNCNYLLIIFLFLQYNAVRKIKKLYNLYKIITIINVYIFEFINSMNIPQDLKIYIWSYIPLPYKKSEIKNLFKNFI